MGVGGIGISALARLLRARGHSVSGCDAQLSDLTAALEAEGIRVWRGHDPAHLTGVNVLVASNAVPEDQPEVRAAREAGLPVWRRMRVLGDLMRGAPSIGVTGTHGKTSTTSMIAVALAGAGLDPSAFVGGLVPEFGGPGLISNARIGAGPFVAEVDESDPDFEFLECDTAVFTNAEDDHVGAGEARATYWASVEQQHAAFARFAGRAGRALYCADWPGLRELVVAAPEKLGYGLSDGSDYQARFVKQRPSGTNFSVFRRGEELGRLHLALPGQHNVQNALAALAVADLYGADFGRAAAALSAFRGAGRRWQLVGELNGAQIVDDYAHNPTKVAAALEGARQSGRRVRAVFQPHRYLRTQQVWPRLADSLMGADEVLLLDIAAAGEASIPGVHSKLIEDKLREGGHQHVMYYPERTELLSYLRATASENDLIVCMGAGDVWQVARDLVTGEGQVAGEVAEGGQV